MNAPHPHVPDASDTIVTSHSEDTTCLCHSNPVGNSSTTVGQTRSSCSVVVPFILLRNVLPGLTTQHVCWSWLLRESSSLFMQYLPVLASHPLTSRRRYCSFSCGSLSSPHLSLCQSRCPRILCNRGAPLSCVLQPAPRNASVPPPSLRCINGLLVALGLCDRLLVSRSSFATSVPGPSASLLWERPHAPI